MFHYYPHTIELWTPKCMSEHIMLLSSICECKRTLIADLLEESFGTRSIASLFDTDIVPQKRRDGLNTLDVNMPIADADRVSSLIYTLRHKPLSEERKQEIAKEMESLMLYNHRPMRQEYDINNATTYIIPQKKGAGKNRKTRRSSKDADRISSDFDTILREREERMKEIREECQRKWIEAENRERRERRIQAEYERWCLPSRNPLDHPYIAPHIG